MNTEEKIARLEQQITELRNEQDQLYRRLAGAQLDQWKSRVEDLEVQFHLGAMEANDRATVLLKEVRSRWAEVRTHADGAASTASDVGEALRDGLESAVRDLRKALLESKARISD